MAPTVRYRVRSLDECVAHVDVADLKREADRLLEPTGEMRLLDLYDPDGNRIQLAQELRD